MFVAIWQRVIPILTKKKYHLLVLTLTYYASLYFSTSNRTLLLFTFLYWVCMWIYTGSVTESSLYAFIVTLPFPKGKADQLLLIPKEAIPHYALYNVAFYFPIYLSDFFLSLLVYLYVREKFFFRKVHKDNLISMSFYGFFVMFILWVMVSGVMSIFPEIGILSSIQLLRMLLVVSLPVLLQKHLNKQVAGNVFVIVIALLLFQSIWTILQRIHGGPLGKDIEVYLPGAQYGIYSSENNQLLRNTGTFFEPSILGTFLLIHLSIIGNNILKNSESAYKRVSWLALLLGSIALVFTGSRVLYGLWVVLASFFLYKWKSTDPKASIKIRGLFTRRNILGIIIVTCGLLPYVFIRLSSLTDVFTKYGSASYRIQMIQYALRLAESSPLLGIGINLSPYYLASSFVGEQYVFDPTYPHNLISQLAAEVGFIGLGFFSICMGILIKKTFRAGTGIHISSFGFGAIAYVVCAQFYPIFLNHTELSTFFFLYAGFALVEKNYYV